MGEQQIQEKSCGIYCIENTVNERKYIGLSRDIKRRWNEHTSKLNKHTHPNQYLQSAWDKYGASKFKFYIIELCEEEHLSERECYYIQLYNTLSYENGYNLTIGGENMFIGKAVIYLKDGTIYDFVHEAASDAGVVPLTMITWCRQRHNYMYLQEFEQLSQDEKTYWINFDWEEFDHQKLSKAHSRENLSDDTIKKVSMATSGENNPRALKVYCPQLDEEFNCIKYAADKYGINRGSISSCIKGRLKSAGKHPITGEKLTWELVEK